MDFQAHKNVNITMTKCAISGQLSIKWW